MRTGRWLLIAVVVLSVALWTACRTSSNRQSQKLGGAAKVTEQAKPAKAETVTGTMACCESLSFEEGNAVKVNRTDKDGNGEILVYSGPAVKGVTLKDLVDGNKVKAIKLDKGPVSVYLASITFDTEGSELEHYYGIVRKPGVISNIGCVRWPKVLMSPATEKGEEGKLNVCYGLYPPDRKPKVLQAGTISPKGGEIIFATAATTQTESGRGGIPPNIFDTPVDPWRLTAICAFAGLLLFILYRRGPYWWRRRRPKET